MGSCCGAGLHVTCSVFLEKGLGLESPEAKAHHIWKPDCISGVKELIDLHG